MFASLRSTLVLVSMAIPAAGLARPVVGPGGKPSVALSWTTKGQAVTFRLAASYDSRDVAEAITRTVKGVTARVEGDTVVVSGLAEPQLLTALENVEVSDHLDDVDSMLASLQNPGGGDDESSGSSIRATQAADFSEVLGKRTELLSAKVVEIKRARFPLVFVTVKVVEIPKGYALPGVKTGSRLTVLPRVKSRSGVVDPEDGPSKLNIGAWYAQPGDTVWLRLEKEPKDNVWVAAAFDRRLR